METEANNVGKLAFKTLAAKDFSEFNTSNNSNLCDIFWRILLFDAKKSSLSQAFGQSFFRKKGDCEDIRDACQEFLTQQKPDAEIVELRASMAAG